MDRFSDLAQSGSFAFRFGEVPRMSLNFSVGVWLSLGLVFA